MGKTNKQMVQLINNNDFNCITTAEAVSRFKKIVNETEYAGDLVRLYRDYLKYQREKIQIDFFIQLFRHIEYRDIMQLSFELKKHLVKNSVDVINREALRRGISVDEVNNVTCDIFGIECWSDYSPTIAEGDFVWRDFKAMPPSEAAKKAFHRKAYSRTS